MRDEELAVGDDLQTVSVVHRIVGDQEKFRGDEDEERGEAKGDPENGFESGTALRSGTAGAGGDLRGSCHYSPPRWLDVMTGATKSAKVFTVPGLTRSL